MLLKKTLEELKLTLLSQVRIRGSVMYLYIEIFVVGLLEIIGSLFRLSSDVMLFT